MASCVFVNRAAEVGQDVTRKRNSSVVTLRTQLSLLVQPQLNYLEPRQPLRITPIWYMFWLLSENVYSRSIKRLAA